MRNVLVCIKSAKPVNTVRVWLKFSIESINNYINSKIFFGFFYKIYKFDRKSCKTPIVRYLGCYLLMGKRIIRAAFIFHDQYSKVTLPMPFQPCINFRDLVR